MFKTLTKREALLKSSVFFSIFGALFSGFALRAKFDVSIAEACKIGESFDCDLVNQSSYSELFGIPVSVLGLLTYALFLVILTHYDWIPTKMRELVYTGLGTLVLIGLAFSFYLTGIEAFVLDTWCILCVGSQFSIIGLAISFLWLRHLELNK
jgi:vitamin-K-epoxide reductase (warfarin-sensitive)